MWNCESNFYFTAIGVIILLDENKFCIVFIEKPIDFTITFFIAIIAIIAIITSITKYHITALFVIAIKHH